MYCYELSNTQTTENKYNWLNFIDTKDIYITQSQGEKNLITLITCLLARMHTKHAYTVNTASVV